MAWSMIPMPGMQLRQAVFPSYYVLFFHFLYCGLKFIVPVLSETPYQGLLKAFVNRYSKPVPFDPCGLADIPPVIVQSPVTANPFDAYWVEMA